MNKGLQLALGDYIGILNSDDFYKKDSLKIIIKYFKKHKDIDFIFGTVFKGKILSGFGLIKLNGNLTFTQHIQ